MYSFQPTCPSCGGPWDERPELLGAVRASTFGDCAFRCHACGLGFSNSSRRPSARVRITREPELNVPPEARDGLSATLDGAANVVNRATKRKKFCSANSEDAVTWTVVRGLLAAGALRAIAEDGPGATAEAPADAVLLWGHPVTGDQMTAVASELAAVCDALGESPARRSEPDVVAVWPDLVVLVEAKFRSPNDHQPGYANYARYTDDASFFMATDDEVRAEGSYQLLRNWVIGCRLATRLDRPFRLVNLGPGTLESRSFAALLAESAERRFVRRTWREVLDAAPSVDWLHRYVADVGLLPG